MNNENKEAPNNKCKYEEADCSDLCKHHTTCIGYRENMHEENKQCKQ